MAPRKKAVTEPVEEFADEPEDIEEVAGTVIDIASLRADVYKTMGIKIFEPEARFVLKLRFKGAEYFHCTMGTPNGLPYGKIYEISGAESHGKSLLQKLIYGEAQHDGAVVIHGDIEDSDDAAWNTKLGVDNDQLIPVKPKMIYVPLSKEHKAANKAARDEWNARSAKFKLANPFEEPHKRLTRPQTAEEIFDEIEKLVSSLHESGVEKMVIGIDSLANLTTELQLEAGVHGNMRTNSDFSMFLSRNLKRWQIMAANYNVLVILINQLREKPGVMFGDPLYEPGGRALRHNCASRQRANRIGNGKIFKAGKLNGIRGALKNIKNKSGEGSMEHQMCEYNVQWDDRPLMERVSFSLFTPKAKVDKAADVD